MALTNGYGATNGHPPHESGSENRQANEAEPLLSQPVSKKSQLQKRLNQNIARKRADIVLLLCYTITGLLDSAAISTWGSFVSMQTGNTVYIGLGLSAPRESNRWIKSSISLLAFCIGSLTFSRFHRRYSPSKRWVLISSFLLQAALILIAAAILTFLPSPSSSPDKKDQKKPHLEEISWNVLLPIALIAFQACGQAVVSRALKYNALTSVVLTSIYCDLFSDQDLFALRNVDRNRRVAGPLLLLLGAVMGGSISRSVAKAEGVLWLVGGLKMCVAGTWLFWPGEEDGD